MPRMTPEQMLDRLEIEDLLTRYATGVDRKDWDLWESCFTPEAVIDYTAFGGISGGVSEVRAWLEKTMGIFAMSQHMVMNKEIELSGDSATSRAGFYNPMSLAIDDGEKRLLFFEGGYYLDQLVRTADGWKICERVEEFSYSTRLNPHSNRSRASGPPERCRPIDASDLARVSRWNQQLQNDEGAAPMALDAVEARLQRWLISGYEGLIFEVESVPVGYALYRQTDPDLKEPDGVYLRQFFILREHRRRGLGTRAFQLFRNEALGGRRLVLEALASNPDGEAFWRSLGMTPYSVTFELKPDAAANPSGRSAE